MPHTSQCTWVAVVRLIDTSGSWKCRTKLRVPAGTFDHDIAGETGAVTACVYFSGMSSPSGQPEIVSVKPGAAGGAAGAGCCAGSGTVSAKPKTRRKIEPASFMGILQDDRKLTAGRPARCTSPHDHHPNGGRAALCSRVPHGRRHFRVDRGSGVGTERREDGELRGVRIDLIGVVHDVRLFVDEDAGELAHCVQVAALAAGHL